MIVTWEIDDGYAGPHRPQQTTIDDEELAECETKQDREDLIAMYIQEDFLQLVSWYETTREG